MADKRTPYLLITLDPLDALPAGLGRVVARNDRGSLVTALDFIQSELHGLAEQPRDHDLDERPVSKQELTFDSTAERETYVASEFSELRALEAPGCYMAPDGRAVGVFLNTVTVLPAGTSAVSYERAVRGELGPGSTVPMIGGHTATISWCDREQALAIDPAHVEQWDFEDSASGT
jgi:hypothetical protein